MPKRKFRDPRWLWHQYRPGGPWHLCNGEETLWPVCGRRYPASLATALSPRWQDTWVCTDCRRIARKKGAPV